MKIRYILFLLISFLFSHHSSKASGEALGSAAAAIALSGTIYTINSIQYDEWLNSEVFDWKYDETDLTTSLSRECDMNLELRIHSHRRQSYIVYVLNNQSGKKVSIKANDILLKFSSGADRLVRSNFQISDQVLDQGWLSQGVISVPEKSELRDIAYLEIQIPTIQEGSSTTCMVKGVLNKNKNRVPRYEDYSRLLTGEFSFGVGAEAFSESHLKTLSNGEAFFNLNFNFYFLNNYGFQFGYIGQDLGNNKDQDMKISRNLTGGVSINQSQILLGLAANFLEGRMLSKTFSTGLMIEEISNFQEGKSTTLESKTGFYVHGLYNYIFYSSDYLPIRGDYMIGIGAYFKYIPTYNVGTVQFGGPAFLPYLNFSLGI